MDFPILNAGELPIALRAWATIARADGAVASAEHHLLEVVAKLHGVDLDEAMLEPIAPEEVARGVTDPHRAKRVVQLAMVIATVNGDVSPAREEAVQALARALGIEEQGLKVLHEMAHGHRLLARMDMTRRMFGRFGSEAFADGGVKGLWSFVEPMVFKGGEDPALARRYQVLGELPEGTLGRAYFDWTRKNGFAFPGEKGGMPERAVFHDLGHVLAGYGTDARSEVQQGAFQAGFVRKDGFAFLFFVILQFHLGVKITPVAAPEVGLFDVDLVLRALRRGAQCKVDLSDHWDFWKEVGKPLEQVRAEYGIPPLA